MEINSNAIIELKINSNQLKKAAQVYRAINHPLRRQILAFIHEKGRVTVTELHQKLNLPQAVASQQLAILRNSSITVTEREGRWMFYSLNYQKIKQLHEVADELLG